MSINEEDRSMCGTHVGSEEAKTLVSMQPSLLDLISLVVFAEALSHSGWKPYAVCIHNVNLHAH